MKASILPQKRAKARGAGDRSATFAFWIFVAPALIGLTVFTVIPIFWGLALSFSQAQNTISPVKFIGFANYIDLLTDEAFLRSLITILVFAAFIVPLTFAVSLGLALLVHQAGWGRAFFRTVFFIPSAVSYVIASMVWKQSLFSGPLSGGLANQITGAIGHAEIAWIGTISPPWYWLVLVSVRLWLQVGFYMIIFLAGLQEIPPSLYEAASVDGAKPGWQIFRFITLPQLRATTISVLILNLIAAFQAFDEFYNILNGAGAAQTLARPPLIYLYNLALGDQDFGRGTAGAFILTALILVITLVQGRILGFGDKD
ncbi:multiple sugar transport system permease protein [Abditibacterium utsteinense]|uniref:Multiple sugar transport system permease protein n=1 Tax=Abditibacterium utsteinense TaxID=1960156 RepID=A0A2S8SQI7_9BACT|nr:sugar ABC transporter permease [Abditibacterium utsteinense]PQV63071.1 multiple sugar transport system permease protein [Abditibacterium utsteinense]